MREMTMKETSKEAKLWQLVLFPMNDIATNIIMMLMVFVSYFYTGAIGSSVVFISSFLTGMRAFWWQVSSPVCLWQHFGAGIFRKTGETLQEQKN